MRRRFDKCGILAVHPSAFFELFVEPSSPTNTRAGSVEVVDVRGPLTSGGGWWCETYEAICERVAAACSGDAETIVLRLDTPGGDVSGMIDASRKISALAEEAGKLLVAYVDGQACSAGYALACACDEIVVSEVGLVGSVGVISMRRDETGQDSMFGLRYSVVTSGARKADGHPKTEASDAETAATQRTVNSLASTFFGYVADRRKSMSVDDVSALEAGVFHGESAVKAGLADRVQSFDALLASLAGAGEKMPTKCEEARAALESAAEGDDEKEAKRAKKALAAMNDEDEGEDKDAARAESDDAPADDDEDEKDKAVAAATVSAQTAGEIGAQVSELTKWKAQMEAERDNERRSALLATRPDLGADLVKVLGTKPFAEVKSIVSAIPKPTAPKPAGTAVPAATRGATQGEQGQTADGEVMAAMMGLRQQAGGVKMEGQTLRIGVMSVDAARKAAGEGK